jgi:ABC-type antimicrobial peptide transport system permease subunit
VLAAIKQIDRTATPGPMRTMDEALADEMSALGFIAALLTVVGSYVVAESMAVARRREMAIRAALGARRVQLVATVLAETGRLVGFGLLGGLVLAWMGANTIRALLFHVQPLDPAAFVGVAAAIFVLSIAVSLRPALRAARVDLSRVLREE